jgi:peptidoglycan/LPS O-acetylase OafA/YrhL
VLVPLLVGVLTVLPACLAVWISGWLLSGRCTWKEAVWFLTHLTRRPRFWDPAIRNDLLGSGHLWFLEYLMLMLVAYALIRWLTDNRKSGRVRLGRLLDRVLASPWAPFCLALPSTALLWLSRERYGIDAALDRHNSFLINPLKMAHHASFFVVGLGIYRFRHDLERLAKPSSGYLALSIPVFVGRGWLLGQSWSSPLNGAAGLAVAALGGLFSWLVVFGFVGAALRVFRAPLPALRYLADSSYWIYLIHMPIIGLVQVDLARVPGHALWKCPVVLITTLAIGLASYQTLVRHGALGTWLHGKRERRAAPERLRPWSPVGHVRLLGR